MAKRARETSDIQPEAAPQTASKVIVAEGLGPIPSDLLGAVNVWADAHPTVKEVKVVAYSKERNAIVFEADGVPVKIIVPGAA